MSATNRFSERAELDSYWTPIEVARATVERLLKDGVIKKGGAILEPSVGKGAFAIAALELLQPDELDLVDLVIRPELKALGVGARRFEQDFLTFRPEYRYDGIYGNPPFDAAEAHVRHALSLLKPDGVLAFLLRLNFLSGRSRHRGLWKEHPPEFISVLDGRPSFKKGQRRPKIDKATGLPKLKKDGSPIMVQASNDSCEYAIICWRGTPPEFETTLRFLAWEKAKKKKGTPDGASVP